MVLNWVNNGSRWRLVVDFLVFQLAANDDFLFGPTIYLQPMDRQPGEPAATTAAEADLLSFKGAGTRTI